MSTLVGTHTVSILLYFRANCFSGFWKLFTSNPQILVYWKHRAEEEESEGILQGYIQRWRFEGFLVFPDLLPYNGPGKTSSACPGAPAGHGLEGTKLSGAPCGYVLSYSLGLMVSLVPRPNTNFWPAPLRVTPQQRALHKLYARPLSPHETPLSPMKKSLLCSRCPRRLGPESHKPESFRTVSLLSFSSLSMSPLAVAGMYQIFVLPVSQIFNIFISTS